MCVCVCVCVRVCVCAVQSYSRTGFTSRESYQKGTRTRWKRKRRKTDLRKRLDVILKSWRYWVEFAVIVSQRHGVKDLGHKLLQLKADLESTAGEKLNRTWQCFVGVKDCCFVLDVGDECVVVGPDRRTEITQQRRERQLLEKNNSLTRKNEELAVKNESLAKEKKVAENKEELAVRREIHPMTSKLSGYAVW